MAGKNWDFDVVLLDIGRFVPPLVSSLLNVFNGFEDIHEMDDHVHGMS